MKGAKCKNEITGEEFDVRAKTVINATGPFTDSIRYVALCVRLINVSQNVFSHSPIIKSN